MPNERVELLCAQGGGLSAQDGCLCAQARPLSAQDGGLSAQAQDTSAQARPLSAQDRGLSAQAQDTSSQHGVSVQKFDLVHWRRRFFTRLVVF